ncbi:hypothetical protein K493DRAFT_348394 [Basidiobolus meristosporus CBS 931.73]|uniref:CCD97-like C-terminal domain-containing protein n=1 Tax=Basidiobolus meristosporus CBS 931.73 TaxID=1314790 RepID=A0A1Y1YNZ8_9FUNG|nr:hypothetical protein K493DRAFT_348394 [Basidiobolus meristosporus CBS 931.73]|eukprot:ORX99747.1 hypothetical protein K493DRAFT_348394 [Basidiobolus meristosporus CBS 931.73]
MSYVFSKLLIILLTRTKRRRREEERGGGEGEGEEKGESLDPTEREDLISEFKDLMKYKFLSGDDKHFDYSKVDTNEEYDDLHQVGEDLEAEYFDSEEPNEINIENETHEYDY